jgi:putative membrane protein
MRRPELRHLPWIQRILLVWAIEAITFGVMITLIPSISFQAPSTALLTAAVVGLANALVRPLLARSRLAPSLHVFGIIALGLNVLIVWLASEFVRGVALSEIWLVLLVSTVLAFVNVTFSDLFAIDDDDSYFHHLVSRIAVRPPSEEPQTKPGVLFLEIDGLSERVLQQAIHDGYMPTLAGWLKEGTHRIVGWECDVPSQTSASQAGILLGNNFDIPAFRWYEKTRGTSMISNRAFDAAELERRLSTGAGLLAHGGASRANLFSGDAPQAIFTFSTLTDSTRHSPQDFYPLFVGPYNVLRMTLMFLLDILAEIRAATYQRRKNVKPRIHRGGAYPLLRAFTTVLMRELSSYIMIGDMYAGVPSVYATLFGYDEVAHHSGVERPDALEVLEDLDELFDRLHRVARRAPRPYQFVLLSDHGQSQGATFKQRYGKTLEEFVSGLVSERHTVESVKSEDAAWGNLNILLTDLLHDVVQGDNSIVSRLFRRFVRARTFIDENVLSQLRESFESQRLQIERQVTAPSWKNLEQVRNKIEEAVAPFRKGFEEQSTYLQHVIVGPYRKQIESLAKAIEARPSEVVVLASGNLGLIYFTRWKARASREQIEEAFPGLLMGLAGHEGIGFILVHSDQDGPLVIGSKGVYYLEGDRVEGENPLTNFGKNAAEHLRRLDSFPHVADITVNSLYDPETGEVAAFEELVGSHGGLGGGQMLPFLMFPAEWKLKNEEIVGAVELHLQLQNWLAQYS